MAQLQILLQWMYNVRFVVSNLVFSADETTILRDLGINFKNSNPPHETCHTLTLEMLQLLSPC